MTVTIFKLENAQMGELLQFNSITHVYECSKLFGFYVFSDLSNDIFACLWVHRSVCVSDI